MLRFILIVLIMTSPFGGMSQLNIDSLFQELQQNVKFTKTIKVQYLLDSFQRFEYKNGYGHFDVYVDSFGKLSDYIGLSMIHRSFNSDGNLVLREGYTLKGNYQLWDYSPILKVTYPKNYMIKEYYNKNKRLNRVYIVQMDSLERIVKEWNLDKDYCHLSKTTYHYNDSSQTLIIKYVNEDGTYQPNDQGVSMVKKVWKGNDVKNVTEITYMNKSGELVDGLHEKWVFCLPHSKVIIKEGDSVYYNKLGEVVPFNMYDCWTY